MVLAWMVFGSLSVLFPRYFKTAWPDKKLLGDAVWFQVKKWSEENSSVTR